MWRHPRDILSVFGLQIGLHTHTQTHTRSITHFCRHITVEALKYRHKTDFTCHRMRHTCSNKNVAEHMQITNQVRNGIKDFKEYTLSWTTAMDYRLVTPAYYATGMFAVDEHSALMLTVM